MAKILYIIKPHSVIDVITNSSSELFVFQDKEKEIILEMLDSLSRPYGGTKRLLEEYEPIRSIEELTEDEVETFLDFAGAGMLTGFSDEEMYEESSYGYGKYLKGDFVHNNFSEIVKQLAARKMYFLFSLYDNPAFDIQEVIEHVGTRYHLG